MHVIYKFLFLSNYSLMHELFENFLQLLSVSFTLGIECPFSSLFLISNVLTVTSFISMSFLEFICLTGYVCSIAGLLCH